MLLHTGTERRAEIGGVLTTVACGPRGERAYAREGSILVAGAAVQWLREGLGLLESSADSEAMARAVESTEGVYFVPAFAGLGTPWWDPEVRGTMVGLTRGSRREHVVRATLESSAYAKLEVLEVMTAGRVGSVAELRADGGVTRNSWLMQFQADVLGVPVRGPSATELTAIGAAGLAGVKTGFWSRPEDFLPARGEDRVYEPRADRRAEVVAGKAGWDRALETARFWAAAHRRPG